MVVVVTPQNVYVERDACCLCKALQAVRQHLGAEVTNLLAFQSKVHYAIWPIRQVHHSTAEGFIQRRVRRTKAC